MANECLFTALYSPVQIHEVRTMNANSTWDLDLDLELSGVDTTHTIASGDIRGLLC